MFEGGSRSHALRGNGFWRLRLPYQRQSRISPGGVQALPGHQGMDLLGIAGSGYELNVV
jgi:hypothetical protein